MDVTIVDCGIGNIRSVQRMFEAADASAEIVSDPAALASANRVVLPGVGAFDAGMHALEQGGWIGPLNTAARDRRIPVLGICLGMQMLATEGEEGGINRGLGFVAGRVRRLDVLGCTLRVPHVGWNEINFNPADPLFAHIPQRSDFYFVHSFAFVADAESSVTGHADYGVPVVASVRQGSVFGTQFHPEKSSKAGRQLLRNFLEFKPC